MQIIKPNMLKFHIHDKSIIIILTFLDLYKTLSWAIFKEFSSSPDLISQKCHLFLKLICVSQRNQNLYLFYPERDVLFLESLYM